MVVRSHTKIFIMFFIVSLVVVTSCVAESVDPFTKAHSIKRRGKKRLSSKPTLSTMKFDQLKVSKEKYLAKGDKQTAIKYLERMVKECDDLQLLSELMLEIANLLFDVGELGKAEKMFTEFVNLYPGHTKVEHALYRAILCSFYSTLDAERDQTKTEDTIGLCKNFLQRAQVFTQHAQEVQSIQAKCQQKLVAAEINIVNFYTKSGRFKSAEKRLAGLRKDFLNTVPAIEPQIMHLEYVVAQKQNKVNDAQQKYKEINEKFPNYFNTQLASYSAEASKNKQSSKKNNRKKTDFVTKF